LPAVTVKHKDCEQVHVLVGAEGVSASDDRRFAYSVLDTILGGGMASRLFHEIRSKRGLAYSVYSAHHSYRVGGLLTIAAATGPESAREVIAVIRQELAALAADGVAKDELTRAKEHIKGGILLSLESTSTRMLRLGHSELNIGRVLSPAEAIQRVDAVLKEDVDVLARELFPAGRTALTVLGPIDEKLGVELAGSLAQSA
jgi:predicted Zn-dependent peptidase